MTQEQATNIMKMGHSVFLTGGAGSGKTYVLNRYINYLRDHAVPVAVTASTGIAATHIHGMTIHAWSGIGVRDVVTDYDLEIMETKKYLWDRYAAARVLIIDEISMLSGNYFSNIDRVCRHMRRNTLPFGGLQVIVCGDLFQLPPIEKGNQNDIMMVVDTTAWQSMKPVICYISEQHRQDDDRFTQILNAIRSSSVTDDHVEILLDQVNQDGSDDSGETVVRYDVNDNDTSVTVTKLFTHNVDVDRVNETIFEGMSGKSRTYFMTASGRDNLIEGLKRSCLAPEVLNLKIGAEIMFVKNNFDAGYVNGTRGTVTGFDTAGNPIVRTVHDDEITVEPVDWSIQTDDGKILASITQLPVRHAWAITVHKSQGMSLDGAHIDLSKAFTYGMGYVALSRVRTLAGLQLSPITHDQLRQALLVDPRIALVDIKLQKQSAMAAERLTHMKEPDMTKFHHEFIIRSGGSIDVVAKSASGKGTKKSAMPGKSSETISWDMFQTGMGLAQIASDRGLKIDTIIDHIGKQTITDTDRERITDEIYHVCPDIDKKSFKKALKLFQKIGSEKLTPIKRELAKDGNDVSYSTLKLLRLLA